MGMAGRYTGSYPDRSYGWRAVATVADIGQASLVERIPDITYDFASMATTKLGAREPFRGASTTSALRGEPDIASETAHVREVP